MDGSIQGSPISSCHTCSQSEVQGQDDTPASFLSTQQMQPSQILKDPLVLWIMKFCSVCPNLNSGIPT